MGIASQSAGEDASGGSADAQSLALAVAAKRGDERAVERLWRLHERDLHTYLSRYLADPRDVAEAAQEVFIKMDKALPGYEAGEVPFRFWLFRIARNHAVDVIRRDKHSRVEEQDRLNRLLEDSVDDYPTHLSGWLQDERTALAFSKLSVEQQRMLLLRFGFGFKSEEVAEVLGCSPDAARKQQSRALRRLAEALDDSEA